jgi:hypothetical protein
MADNYAVKDGNGILLTFAAKLLGGILYPLHMIQGLTANGNAASTPPVLIGGTADGSATGAVGNAKVDAAGLVHVSVDAGSITASFATETPLNFALVAAAQVVKASAGQLKSIHITNPNALAYVQVFDKAAGSVVLGTDVPKLIFGCAANGTTSWTSAGGANFATAISIACTTTPSGSTAPTNAATVAVTFQ